jgi:hypothetical protein
MGTTAIACDCKSLTLRGQQNSSFKESYLIFIGDVLESDSKAGTYRFQVVEFLKGQSETNIIVGKYLTGCSGFPKSGRWIIYVDTFKNGIMNFNSCGLSRSFHEPHFVSVTEYRLPPPIETKQKDSKKSIQMSFEFERAMATIQERALKDLELEIDQLRNRK